MPSWRVQIVRGIRLLTLAIICFGILRFVGPVIITLTSNYFPGIDTYLKAANVATQQFRQYGFVIVGVFLCIILAFLFLPLFVGRGVHGLSDWRQRAEKDGLKWGGLLVFIRAHCAFRALHDPRIRLKHRAIDQLERLSRDYPNLFLVKVVFSLSRQAKLYNPELLAAERNALPLLFDQNAQSGFWGWVSNVIEDCIIFWGVDPLCDVRSNAPGAIAGKIAHHLLLKRSSALIRHVVHAVNSLALISNVKSAQFNGLEKLQIDFCGVEISEMSIDSLNIHSSQFGNCKFTNVMFQGCTFEGFFPRGRLYQNCTFQSCTFRGASFDQVNFNGSKFSGCTFLGTHLEQCHLRNVEFEGTRFGEPGCCLFCKCDMTNVRFYTGRLKLHEHGAFRPLPELRAPFCDFEFENCYAKNSKDFPRGLAEEALRIEQGPLDTKRGRHYFAVVSYITPHARW